MNLPGFISGENEAHKKTRDSAGDFSGTVLYLLDVLTLLNQTLPYKTTFCIQDKPQSTKPVNRRIILVSTHSLLK